MAALVSALATPEYREWLSARETLRLAYEGGAHAVGLQARQAKPSHPTPEDPPHAPRPTDLDLTT